MKADSVFLTAQVMPMLLMCGHKAGKELLICLIENKVKGLPLRHSYYNLHIYICNSIILFLHLYTHAFHYCFWMQFYIIDLNIQPGFYYSFVNSFNVLFTHSSHSFNLYLWTMLLYTSS